ncbi:MAG: hypothetical protein HY321_01780 [Armatimonadetes bacterium]|nr:hypothetical protein [Armatimonadota bacterium]
MSPRQVRVLFTRLSAVARPRELEAYGRALPEPLRRRHDRYRRDCDRRAGILGKWLVAEALSDLGYTGAFLEHFHYDAVGRPAVSGLAGVDISISHSEDLVVCAAARAARVGVDVEFVRAVPLDDFRDVFPPAVWEGIPGDPQPLREFYRCWTRLEAVAKGEGFGLGGPVRAIALEGDTARYGGRRWVLSELTLEPDYACHLAVAEAPAPITLEERFFDG